MISEVAKYKNKIILDTFFPQGIFNKKILEIGVGGRNHLSISLPKGKKYLENLSNEKKETRNKNHQILAKFK